MNLVLEVNNRNKQSFNKREKTNTIKVYQQKHNRHPALKVIRIRHQTGIGETEMNAGITSRAVIFSIKTCCFETNNSIKPRLMLPARNRNMAQFVLYHI